MSSAVANASPLIALAKIDYFSLLRQLFQDIVVPEAVWQEVVVRGVGKPVAESVVSAVQEGWLRRQPIQDTFVSACPGARVLR